mmetsp:Transcript_74456/g.131568  ORF Transcript_74456/g.131568 Transcript_74456/m.131568 type:complete len:108 (+) Transcript_74456:186-509(+)
MLHGERAEEEAGACWSTIHGTLAILPTATSTAQCPRPTSSQIAPTTALGATRARTGIARGPTTPTAVLGTTGPTTDIATLCKHPTHRCSRLANTSNPTTTGGAARRG